MNNFLQIGALLLGVAAVKLLFYAFAYYVSNSEEKRRAQLERCSHLIKEF